MTGALVATIHDVAPPFLDEVRALRAALRSWGAGAVTLLAVPNHHGRAPLHAHRPTLSWLRACAAGGDEIALHGVTHRQDGPIPAARDRARAALLTAGEGELLARGAAAPERLANARAGLERALGAAVIGFVAPAWLEPRGLAATLAGLGFRWHETAGQIDALAVQRRVRAPVIGFATRSAWRERAAILWARALGPPATLAARLGLAPVRLALHPGDAHRPGVLAAAERVARRALAHGPAVTTAQALALAPRAAPRSPAPSPS
jgi:hypothetical protein